MRCLIQYDTSTESLFPDLLQHKLVFFSSQRMSYVKCLTHVGIEIQSENTGASCNSDYLAVAPSLHWTSDLAHIYLISSVCKWVHAVMMDKSCDTLHFPSPRGGIERRIADCARAAPLLSSRIVFFKIDPTFIITPTFTRSFVLINLKKNTK